MLFETTWLQGQPIHIIACVLTMLRSISTFLALVCLFTLGTEAAASQNFSDEHVATEVDLFVRHLMDCHLTPALTLALVKDGRVVLAKGYGFTNANKTQAVTSKTKFAIASLTKAFTATLVAKWIHAQENITIDTPIRSYFPSFLVTDYLRSREATMRDLLSHRMGIPSYFLPLNVGLPTHLTRDKLVQQMACMPDGNRSFRDKFIYSNYMYTVAAHVLEKSEGQTWEEMVQGTFLTPLNMTHTGFIDTLQNFSDFALACALVNGSIVDLSTDLFNTVSPCGPGGSIYSNAEDMARWMIFQLAEGIGPQNQTVVDPEVIKMTRSPSMVPDLPLKELVFPSSPVSHTFKSYDLGWVTAYYRGYKKIFHAGGIITHSSRLWLFPDANAGIYANVNGPQTNSKHNLLESLMYFASDHLLSEEPWKEKNAVCQTSQDIESGPSRPASNESTNPPQNSADDEGGEGHAVSIVGRYTHQFFGTIEISMQENSTIPHLSYGRYGEMDMYAVSSLEYKLRYTGLMSYMSPPESEKGPSLKFSLNAEGHVESLSIELDSRVDLVKFDLNTA